MTDHLAPGTDSSPDGARMDASEEEGISLLDALTWLGQGRRWVLAITGAVTAAAVVVVLILDPIYTARASLLPPGSQQQSGSAAALAALGALGGLAGGLGAKTPDELYVALLRSDSLLRALDERFALRKRYEIGTYEVLRKTISNYIRVSSDKKSGLISVEVDDKDAKFAADLANAHAAELTKVLGRLAVSEAQQRRIFFEQQLSATKERLIQAEQDLRKVQERSGVIVLDKQAEALIGGAALVRAQISEREVQYKVLRNVATEQNPDVQRLLSELRALRSELARMESTQAPANGGALDLPVGKIPEAAIDYVRARRELKLQETLLEAMLRQFEAAKLDEAREGPALQTVDIAQPPDRKSKPARALIVLSSFALALFLSALIVIARGAMASGDAAQVEQRRAAWARLRSAWRGKSDATAGA